MNFNSLESDWPRSPRVLLVDDDPVNLLLTAMALRERGFDVTEVTSAETALSRLTEIRPDVIALDALMPGMDGFETQQQLALLPQPPVPVIVTAHGTTETAIEATKRVASGLCATAEEIPALAASADHAEARAAFIGKRPAVWRGC
mgnify:CR=1 FL=1